MKNKVSKKSNSLNKSGKNTNDKPPKKRHNFLYVVIMGGLLFLGVSIVYIQYSYTLELNKKNAEVLAEIDKQNKITEKINREKNYASSDEYVEKIAREQLSLVKPDEILFIDLNK